MANDTAGAGADDLRAGLANALTFHASFDRGPDADLALGDPTLYSESASGDPTMGLGDPPVVIAEARGKYGSALEMTVENTHVVLYRAEHNVAYSAEAFRGTVSFWLSLDTDEIPARYCDPLQVTDKKYSDACIWVDITKNDTPSDFRLGVFGDASEWDPDNKEGGGERFFWRLVKAAEPPFARCDSAAACRMSWTTTSWPAFCRLAAMCRPMFPSPMKAIRIAPLLRHERVR